MFFFLGLKDKKFSLFLMMSHKKHFFLKKMFHLPPKLVQCLIQYNIV